MKNKLLTLCTLLALGVSVPITAFSQEGAPGVPNNKDNDRVPAVPTIPSTPANPADPLNKDLIPRDGINDANRDGLNRDRLNRDGLNRDNVNRDPALDRAIPRNARTFEGRVTKKTADSVVIGGKTYKINKQTRFDKNGTLETLKVGDTVNGYYMADGTAMTVGSLSMGPLRDRRNVRDQLDPSKPSPVNPNAPNNRDRLDPNHPNNPAVPGEPGSPGTPEPPKTPGTPDLPRSPGQTSPDLPRAPAPSTPAPGTPK